MRRHDLVLARSSWARKVLANLPRPVLLCPGNEPSGVMYDYSGNVNTLAANAGPTSAAGPNRRLQRSRQYVRASSQFHNIADNALVSTGDIDFTVAAWVYLDSEPAANAYMGFVTKWGAAGTREFTLAWANDATSNRYYFSVSADGTAEVGVRDGVYGDPTTATWVLLIGWHDAAANTINIQVNNGTPTSAAHATGVFDGAADLRIGSIDGTTHFADGRVCGVYYTKNVLTVPQRTFLHAIGRP